MAPPWVCGRPMQPVQPMQPRAALLPRLACGLHFALWKPHNVNLDALAPCSWQGGKMVDRGGRGYVPPSPGSGRPASGRLLVDCSWTAPSISQAWLLPINCPGAPRLSSPVPKLSFLRGARAREILKTPCLDRPVLVLQWHHHRPPVDRKRERNEPPAIVLAAYRIHPHPHPHPHLPLAIP